MDLIINDKPCATSVGQTLGKAARLNHSHVGYICGGHGVCQACYVTVQEGAECLAPLTDIEKAFLSPRQISAGGRLACQATIAKEGRVKVLSRPEAVRRQLFSNPFGLIGIAADMGKDTAQQIVPGIQNLVGRITRGEMGGPEALGDIMESISGAVGLAVETLPQMIPFREQFMGLLSNLPLKLPIQLPFQLPFPLPFGASPEDSAPLERVTITVAAPRS